MKKVLLTILVICLCSFVLVAADVKLTEGIYDSALEAFRPTSVRQLGMGSASVSSARGAESLYVNPASIAKGGFKVAIPSFGITFYNVKDIVDPANTMLDKIIPQDGAEADYIGAAVDYLNIVSKYGKNRIADIDAGVTLQAGPIALGVNAQVKLHTLSEGTLAKTQVLPEINAAATVGLGFRIPLGSLFSIDLGANASFAYKVYTNEISASALSTLLSSEDLVNTLMSDYPVAAGYAIPITAGVNVNLPLGFKASAVARNLNGAYNMTVFPGAATWLQDTLNMNVGGTVDSNFDPETAQTIKLDVPFSLDVGASWQWKNGFLSPQVAVDLVDILNVDFEEEGAWLKNLNIGANIRLLSVLDISAGLNQGYISAGVGLDLFVLHIEAAYAFREFGTIIGEKGIDSLSIKAVIGYDR